MLKIGGAGGKTIKHVKAHRPSNVAVVVPVVLLLSRTLYPVPIQLVHLILSDCDLVLSLYARRGGRNLDTLRGKVVWVTGASSGIGEELTLQPCNAWS